MERVEMSWDKKFMAMAKLVASWSKDPSTKVGAVIVGPNHEIRSTGYNGYPRGILDTVATDDRESRLQQTVHAEMNAIINAALIGTSTKGCTLYVHGLPPCNGCANAIIQAGILRLCFLNSPVPERWQVECLQAVNRIRIVGIQVESIDEE